MAPDTESRTPWLALSFGCCASRRDSIDDNGATLRANGETEMRICYDQPQAVAQPRAEPIHTRPTTSHSMKHVSQWVSSGREFATRASSRASIHTIHKPRNSRAKARPSIGRPTDFRHCDGLDGFDSVQSMLDDAPMPVRRRRSFRPLELSIYLPDGRLSPLPDFTTVEWEKLPAELELPAQALVRDRDSRTSSVSSNRSSSYLIQRKPVGSGSRRSSVQSQNSLQSRPGSVSLPFLLEEPTTRPESVLSNPNTLQRSNTQSTFASTRRIVSRLPSPSRSRSNTETSQRGSLRRAKTDVDEAIRELNTIVEERRASAYRSNNLTPALINRPPPSPSHHVPMIAPSLRMHVRSETLSDIGSAFSVPLACKPLPTPPASKSLSRTNTRLTLSPPSHTSTGGPLSSNPITPPTPTIPTPTTPIHRLGAWLKRSMPTTPTSPSLFKAYSSTSNSKPQTPTTQPAPAATPFYQCTPPLPPSSHSDSPSMKLASRPSTAGSRTVVHTRQDSNDTATVTLFSTNSDHQSYPSTPALSTRSLSPEPLTSPLTPARNTLTQNSNPNPNILKGTGKPRRVPTPLTLAKEKEMMLEAPLASARSFVSTRSANGGQLKPPMSPNYGLLAGMEMSVKAGMRESALSMEGSPVGVAF